MSNDETRISHSDSEWRQRLTEEQYRVCRLKATEHPFSGTYNQCKDPGTYCCVCCGAALFDSNKKFESGSGWPSFYAPVSGAAIAVETDHSHGMSRVEVLCSRCDAHLGHVFDDGPQPTGQRYCINSISLKLKAED